MPCHAMPGNGWLGSSHMLNQLAYMWIKTSYKIDAKWHSREDIKKALTYAEYKKAQKTAAAKVEQMCKGVKKSQQLSADFNIESGELAPTFIPGLFAIAHHLVTSWVNRVPPHVVDTQKQEEWFSIEFVD